jgi:glycerophosphoryl diester phosphodiesterase
VLIALHDDSLNRTTDVAERPEFADLCRTNSRGHACWYPGDFTLEQVKRLRTRQSNSRRPAEHNGREPVPTLAEIVALVRAYCRETGRRVGIVPELKQGGRMVEPFLRFVREQSLEDPRTGIPIYLQCFALDTLKACRPRLQSPCAWLFTKWPDRNEWPALKQQIHTFAVHKSLALADDATPRIAEAHAAGFAVLAWTFADDSYDRTRFPTAEAELRGALENGIDGFFTDSPASGVRVRDTFAAARR